MLEPQQNESLRRAVLHALAIRHPTALPEPAIRTRLVGDRLLDFSFDADALHGALEFLRSMGRVEYLRDDMGVTEYWKATADGVIADERGLR